MITQLLAALLATTAGAPTADYSNTLEFRIAPQTQTNIVLRAVVNGGQYEIFASGVFDNGAHARFNAFVKAHSITDAIVIFDSPGGSLDQGIELGQAIRDLGFDTGIGSYGKDGRRAYSGVCASACAYAFAGGVYRFYYGDKEHLGIHQYYASGSGRIDAGESQVVSSILVDYLQRMGVDPQAFVVASVTPGSSMFWLKPSEAVALGLANNGAYPITAEIKIVGTSPYLRLEQARSNVTARVLLGCFEQHVTLQAGIVTTPDLSQNHWSSLVRNYLETPEFGEILVENESAGARAVQSTLWIERVLGRDSVEQLLQSSQLGIWTENGGPMRWGATIDLIPAHEKIEYFANNCWGSASRAP